MYEKYNAVQDGDGDILMYRTVDSPFPFHSEGVKVSVWKGFYLLRILGKIFSLSLLFFNVRTLLLVFIYSKLILYSSLGFSQWLSPGFLWALVFSVDWVHFLHFLLPTPTTHVLKFTLEDDFPLHVWK